MILIADSSALIALAAGNSLDFIDKLFTNFFIPNSVFTEIAIKEKRFSKLLIEKFQDKVKKVNISHYVITDLTIGIGELEAMALYKELNADKLLVDDKKARKIAIMNNISIVGSIGLIILAKKRKLVNNIKPILDNMRRENIYIKDNIYNIALKEVDEI